MEPLGLTTVLALLGLGAIHGVNPGMGWLFAVALGLQEGRAGAVWRALPPLALGHALAVAATLAVAALAGLVIPVAVLRWAVAGVLVAMGLYRLFRHRHPRGGGMRVGARELVTWSFLMASAHGAGLMVLPVLLRHDAVAAAAHGTAAGHGTHGMHGAPAAAAQPAGDAVLHAGPPAARIAALVPAVLHTLGYLVVAGILAVVVYQKLGLRLLRTMWINLDLIWAGALIVTGVLTPLL
jgi:hypothetical protein